MITVYGRRNSSSVQLVMWAIHELGLEHQRLDYGHGHKATNTEAYLAMNPMGRVPALVDGEVSLFESAAILRYLAAQYGNEDFWPSNPERRAELDKWAEWGKNTFTEAVLDIFVYDVRLDPQTRDPAVLHSAAQKVSGLARLLEDRIGTGPYLCSSTLTFADIACGHILYRYFNLDWSRPELPNLKSYYERLKKRPAFSDNVMISYEDLRGSY